MVDRADAAGGIGAQAALHAHGVPAAVRVEDLLARVEDLDGTPGLLGELRDAELEVERLGLAAERAADGGLDDADAGHVEVEDAGELAMEVVGHLRGGPDGQLPLGVEVADGAVGLDGGVGGALEVVVALDDHVGPDGGRSSRGGFDLQPDRSLRLGGRRPRPRRDRRHRHRAARCRRALAAGRRPGRRGCFGRHPAVNYLTVASREITHEFG